MQTLEIGGQMLHIEGKEFLNDFSYDWVQGFEDLKNLEKAIRVSTFSEEITKRDPEMEFRLLRRLTETQYHNDNLCDFHPDIQKLNRYNNILPFKHSIVTLKIDEDEDNIKDSYINANYINCINGQQKNIIATQGPLQATMTHFWKMVEQEQLSLIVMLCNLKENGKVRIDLKLLNIHQTQCEQYWPKLVGESHVFGKLSVKLESQEDMGNNLTVRLIRISGGDDEGRLVKQIQWIGWPDQGVPQSGDFDIIMQLVNYVIEELEQQKKIVLHCSAGVGRTGTLISLVNLMLILKAFKSNVQKQENNYLIDLEENADKYRISIFGTVRRLREQRWGTVHTSEQYSYLYKFMDQAIKNFFETLKL